ncbi:tetratricopeptide repeat-containing sensor histidine kinase [Polaribacter sp. Hel1_85]|uniref:tetratricopeptide repeat-containing sensor histidine kinase n=1 Tax=Polaribacter sp. Hel1_85 TaxID=1250005 RepID=UPI001F355327|nr:tetratricopeptide repeat-containing sensor histidine kinase [Polaribacter sp. Hel1_85]
MKEKLLLLSLCILISFYCYKIKGEAVFNTASFFVQKKDSLSNEYTKALSLYEKKDYVKSLRLALKTLEKNNSLNETILLNYLIANIYFDTKSNYNALKFYRNTLKFFKKEGNFLDEKVKYLFDENYIKSESLLKYGNSFYRLSFLEKNESFRDSALYYYKQVDKINTFNKKNLEVKSKAYNNISGIYMNDSIYDKAKDFALKSIKIYKKLNKRVKEAGSLSNLSSIYLLEGNYNDAQATYFQAIDLIRNINTKEALKVREKLYYNLAYNLYILKDYKAYDYQELSYNIKDSLRDKELRKMIADVNARHNFDVKKNLLLKEEENKRLKDQRIFLVVGIISFVIILSLLFWLNYYKLKQKNLGLQLSQSELIQNQNIEKIRSESQVRILNATIDGKESERKQIAETLHDSVSALLSSANLHLQATRTQFNGKTPIEIDKTQEIITEASQKIRDLSHTLVSSVLLKFGLKFAIKDMADKYSNSQINIETNIGETRRYHQNFEIKVYNITQEFVNNILKHSKAKNAMIKLDEINGKLSLSISDDGIGFDKTLITNKDGLGLNQIEARIQMMYGEFRIESSKKIGTVIKVVLPILEKEEAILV